jgi:hypothetical protein
LRYQVNGRGWNVGQWLIPSGAVVVDNKWNGIPLPFPPNFEDVTALDQECFDALVEAQKEIRKSDWGRPEQTIHRRFGEGRRE